MLQFPPTGLQSGAHTGSCRAPLGQESWHAIQNLEPIISSSQGQATGCILMFFSPLLSLLTCGSKCNFVWILDYLGMVHGSPYLPLSA